MTNASAEHRYVAEAVWLPTYLGVAILVLAVVDNSAVATAVIVSALIGCRLALELIYRIAFREARLQWRTGLIAFGSQVIVWGLLWAWYAQRTGAA